VATEHIAQRPRVLLIEPDEAVAEQMMRSLGRPCCNVKFTRVPGHEGEFAAHCRCGLTDPDSLCTVVVSSLRQLHGEALDNFDIVICAISLNDGTGLDALAYVRGVAPDVPVVLTGSQTDAALAVESIRAGAMDFLVLAGKESRTLPLAIEKSFALQRIKQENERLQRDLSRSLAELEVKNRQLSAVVQQLEAMARTDGLTGLCNRRWLNEVLERAWNEATRHDRPLAFMMIDLDGFKDLNDRCGHQRGDEILQLAAKVIATNCRQVDVPARYGGDEFCVLMPQTEAHEAVRVAERIRKEFVHALRDVPEGEPAVSMSIGVAHIDLSRPLNAEQLIHHADQAMYAAKNAGKQRVMVRDGSGVYCPIGPS
jgi:diguanylate cyclase (GGDEF)-like protein